MKEERQASRLLSKGQFKQAAEVYKKAGLLKEAASAYLKAKHIKEALALLDRNRRLRNRC